MTLASAIIQRAYRRANLIAAVATPSATEQSEALDHLDVLLLSTIGFEAGQELCDVTVGGTYDQSQCLSTWIPENVRLILNLTGAQSFNLDPSPYDGQRLAIADAAGNLATDNLTLAGNGRNIEGASSLTLATSGDTRQWLYRADTANWVKITSLALTDAMPLPTEFDGYFVDNLAMQLSPSFSAGLPQEILASLSRQKNLIQARYRKPRRQNAPILGLLHQRRGYYSESNSAFNSGRG